jgi:hypothetical protein
MFAVYAVAIKGGGASAKLPSRRVAVAGLKWGGFAS